MKKILIRIKDNDLIFKERIKLSNEHKNLLNTNVISCNELLFSDEYIITNKKIVVLFIKEIIKDYEINRIIIENSSLYDLICSLFINNNSVSDLILKDDTPITYRLCEILIKTNIKSVNCYNIQPFMLELLDEHNIIVESRNEILFLSNFMKDNNLISFSNIYYKGSLKINFPMTNQDEEDFTTFCKINKYLKTIHITKASLKDIDFIVKTLKKNNVKKIKIYIHDNVIDNNQIEYLKDFNEHKSKKYKIKFILRYSDSYIRENILPETNNKILNTCSFIVVLIILISIGYVLYNNYTNVLKDNKLKDDIHEVMKDIDMDEILLQLNKENITNNEEYKVINTDIAALLKTNPETVGWIKVNNTNIDYPIVQASDNDYYLDHDFNMKKAHSGWVFMDYRNEYKDLDDNTIIYAHNRYYSGIMFGTLQNALKSNWYLNKDNQKLSFRTLYNDYEFKIFSIYKIKTTSDYLKTNFKNGIDKIKFIDMLKNRSIYDFKYEPSMYDKILTLSTCADEDSRLVVHGYITEKNNG